MRQIPPLLHAIVAETRTVIAASAVTDIRMQRLQWIWQDHANQLFICLPDDEQSLPMKPAEFIALQRQCLESTSTRLQSEWHLQAMDIMGESAIDATFVSPLFRRFISLLV
jgi:hypothetical protein